MYSSYDEYFTGDTDASSYQPNVAFYNPNIQQQQHHRVGGEATAGNGSRGKPPTRGGTAESAAALPQSAKEFFSKLDWQTGESGYTGFAGESDSESESSSSSEEEEENQEMFGGDRPYADFGATHTHMVSQHL